MTSAPIDIPEIRGLDSRRGLIRIPPETDVPITPRVRRIIDSQAFRRLSRISQLGLVAQVYPAAHHSRFEHSLGVYRKTLLYLRQLSQDVRFTDVVSTHDAEKLIVAALLHDIGHWPFCHPLEDIRDDRVPRHELLAAEFIHGDELACCLREDWSLESSEVTALLEGERRGASARILSSVLSGPIDVDKMDYLSRDSLHAGVPYGQNFDQTRLIGSLCLNQHGDALAISDKGKTAAEMMVFARYVMFSEVYWHHAVRSATAMLQRSFYELLDRLELKTLFHETEQPMIDILLEASYGTRAEAPLHGLFGPSRRLYKRLEQFSLFQQPDVYHRLARRPYAWLVTCADRLVQHMSTALGASIPSEAVLIDSPPVKREIEIEIDVFFPKEQRYRSLADVSPVVQTLAKEQFDDYVKRVRIFVAQDWIAKAKSLSNLTDLLHRSVDELEQSDSPQ